MDGQEQEAKQSWHFEHLNTFGHVTKMRWTLEILLYVASDADKSKPVVVKHIALMSCSLEISAKNIR